MLGNGFRFGLKSFGYHLIANKVRELANLGAKPSVLEMGAGLGSILVESIGGIARYTNVDQEGFYDSAKYANAVEKRKGGTEISGLMGQFLVGQLADNSFDLTCSVSVIEHVPISDIPNCAADCARVTKPGGFFVHTLDVTSDQESIWTAWRKAIERDFEFVQPPQPISFGEDGLLYESAGQMISVARQAKNRSQIERFLSKSLCTIQIIARKR